MELNSGEKESFFRNLDRNYNYLVFWLEGKALLRCNEFSGQTIEEGQMVLVPMAADLACRCQSHCRLMTFGFEKFFELSEREYVHAVSALAANATDSFQPIAIKPPLEKFLKGLEVYLRKGVNRSLLHKLKHAELTMLLHSFYTVDEMANIFHSVAGKSIDFRIRVMRNYRKVEHVEELATLFGTEKRAFGRQFKEEFGTSPYQWLLAQKGKHILFSLATEGLSMDSIRKEHGFKFPGHFTRFCKEQFQATPTELVEKLRCKKENPDR
ncbi:MAG: AraC family transcriptional regulator [Tannerella sp.]|jgi:AraC-like DNA-binding protein|nr:AraC family transcriptional regulator [Tannerella sp.]